MAIRAVLSGAFAGAIALLGSSAAQADAVSDFYADKRIRIIAAAGAGGGFGLRARLLADHIGRYMPGKPATVAEFMPGAGGRKAANYIYSLAPKDGTTFGVLFNNTAAVAVIRPEGTRYDPRRFSAPDSTPTARKTTTREHGQTIERAAPRVNSLMVRRRGGPRPPVDCTSLGALCRHRQERASRSAALETMLAHPPRGGRHDGHTGRRRTAPRMHGRDSPAASRSR